MMILTQERTLLLAELFSLQGKKIRFLNPNTDDVSVGTYLHLVRSRETFAFPTSSTDVRDCYVRITLDSGFDTTLPVTWFVANQGAWGSV